MDEVESQIPLITPEVIATLRTPGVRKTIQAAVDKYNGIEPEEQALSQTEE